MMIHSWSEDEESLSGGRNAKGLVTIKVVLFL